MSGGNQQLVEYEGLRRRYERIGMLGNGRDCVLE